MGAMTHSLCDITHVCDMTHSHVGAQLVFFTSLKVSNINSFIYSKIDMQYLLLVSKFMFECMHLYQCYHVYPSMSLYV